MHSRPVRRRLTLLYGVLFLASGALLLGLTYLLVVHAPLPGQPADPEVPELSGGPQVPEPDEPRLALEDQRDTDRQRLLVGSVAGLAVMAVASTGLGWYVAGRVLQPIDAAMESQRRFVANASHELRTPLTLQHTLLEVALGDPGATVEDLRRTGEQVLAATEQQERIIGSLLVLARSQRGLDRHDPVDVAAIARAVLARADPGASGQEVRSALSPAPTRGDPQLLEQLVANLVDNAVTYNVADGWVEVTTGRVDGTVVLRVSNTGPPVPAAAVEDLLRPFQRLGADRTAGEGHGLGLSIVDAVVTAHRGRLRLEPRPGGGLVATVELSAG